MGAVAFVRAAAIDARPPPEHAFRFVDRLRPLVSTPLNAALSVAVLIVSLMLAVPAFDFLVTDAVWSGGDREACIARPGGPPIGACWPFIWHRLGFLIYGQYPLDQRWRVDVVGLAALVSIVWMFWPSAPRRGLAAFVFFVPLPVFAYVMLVGAPTLGLPYVSTHLWGGVLVTMVISIIGMVVSLPFGTLLALGRRSEMPFVRVVCIVFIEVMRGVPLIAVLFMANRLLPLFLTPGMQPDSLLRVIVGVCLFASAYMAEVIRGGLQAVPKGQYEAARAIGLGYWQMMAFVILPQALKMVIPGIVNSFIALFKDTTLVTIVGIFDFLSAIEASMNAPQWSSPVTPYTGYAFAALFYWICCFAMSRYSLAMEKRLATEPNR